MVTIWLRKKRICRNIASQSALIMQNEQQISTDSDFLIDIDRVIAAKAPGLNKTFRRILGAYLKRIVHQEDINKFIIAKRDVKGIEYAKVIIEKFGANVSIFGLENVPDEGRFVFASNHPLGGLDGMAFIHAVGLKFHNLKFPVNDILLYVRNFSEIFLPVNKVGTTSRHAAELMEEAFRSDCQMLMFPAGLCSRKRNGRIVDLEWKKGFVTKAIETQRDIIPVYISGRNSNFFYNLSNLRTRLGIKVNIEMLFLVDEMYKQHGRHLDVYFGRPIPWQSLESENPRAAAQKIKNVVYALRNNE